MIDADRCSTEFISSSSLQAWRSEERQCRRYAAACHDFRGHTHLHTALLLRVGSSARGSGCRAEREALTKGGNHLEGRSFREDLVADMETLGRVGWVGGLHESRMWGRIQMERGSKTMMESDCRLRPCGRCWRRSW